MGPMHPARMPWPAVVDVVIHAPTDVVLNHPTYDAAKGGDADAAVQLVADTISSAALGAIRASLDGCRPSIVPVHALETTGVNAIPAALAKEIERRLGLYVDTRVIQANLVAHTKAGGFARLARQAFFAGDVTPDRDYLLVDDFIGQGGTLANLRGLLESSGGRVVAATALTGQERSAAWALRLGTLAELRGKHGSELEEWWRDRFGHGFDCLTESEARYLLRTPDADRIRARVAAEEPAGDCGPV